MTSLMTKISLYVKNDFVNELARLPIPLRASLRSGNGAPGQCQRCCRAAGRGGPRRQRSEPARSDRLYVVAAGRGRLDPPGPGTVDHGDGFMQLGADVVQADAVLGRVSSREPAAGDVLAEDAARG